MGSSQFASFNEESEAVEDESTVEEVAQTAPAVRSTSAAKHVRYTGAREEHASMRRIKPEAWASVGVTTGRTDVWHLGNDWKLPANQFSPEQLDYLLDVDGRFELLDADGKIVNR